MHAGPVFGARVSIHTRSDSPSARASRRPHWLAGALAAWTGRTLTDDELLALVMNVEAQVIGVPTGVRTPSGVLWWRVCSRALGHRGSADRARGDAEELGHRLVWRTGGASPASITGMSWFAGSGRSAVRGAFDAIRDAAAEYGALERRQWRDLAMHLAGEWESRKRLAPAVTTPEIDRLIERAEEAGALAGKVCGAGGGGCLFCLVEPERHHAVSTALAAAGATVLPFTIDTAGLVVERS